MAIAYNIQVDVPQVSGAPAINIDELRAKIQDFVNGLYVHVSLPSDKEEKNSRKYSKRLQHLRELSHKVVLTSDDMKSDDRLAYLLSK